MGTSKLLFICVSFLSPTHSFPSLHLFLPSSFLPSVRPSFLPSFLAAFLLYFLCVLPFRPPFLFSLLYPCLSCISPLRHFLLHYLRLSGEQGCRLVKNVTVETFIRQHLEILPHEIKNTSESPTSKGVIARDEQFLLLPQHFQKARLSYHAMKISTERGWGGCY